MDHVVVGFDGSPSAAAALRWAADEARLHHAGLLVCAVTAHPQQTRAEPDPAFTGGYPMTVHRETGDVATTLRSACGPRDLLVLGTRARLALRERVLGSVSRACLVHAPCPVAVVRTSDQLHHRRGWVIAAVRSTPAARRILTAAAAEAHVRAAPLIALHTREITNIDPELFLAAATRLLDQGRDWLATQSRAAGVHAVPEVALGPAATTLIRRSHHAALLVLGAHESSRPWGGVPGATISLCVHRATCPVMVVPASA